MGKLFALLLSFQLITAPVAAELGEVKGFQAREYTTNLVASAHAAVFEAKVQKALQRIRSEGFTPYFNENLKHYDKEDQETIKLWLHQQPNERVIFKQVSATQWRAKIGDLVVRFSLEDLFRDQVRFNGKIISMKDISLAQLQKEVEDLVADSRTSSLFQPVLNQLWISEAHALNGVVVVLALLVVTVIWGASKLKNVIETPPIDQKIAGDLKNCREAGHRKTSYNETFEKAEEIAKVQAGVGLRGLLLKSLQGASPQKCPDIFATGSLLMKGDNLSPEQINSLCSQVEQLSECMQNFISAHVQDSSDRSSEEVYNSFLREGKRDHKKYRGATAQ